MSTNDNKIRETVALIEKKRSELGTKPRAVLKSNGILKLQNETINLNTINSISRCVDLTALLLQTEFFYKEACKELGVPFEATDQRDYIEDLKLRASIIKYDAEKKKLDAMEAKLKDLRSADAKTADAIADIMGSL